MKCKRIDLEADVYKFELNKIAARWPAKAVASDFLLSNIKKAVENISDI